ncbi:acid protease [Dissoconium aciculare CBS 342.82]|uniref:Acid protease n=1 Tax=Dissoconium aciculare CBS 342.82 TaxID=1314786 RepID=A0A6J3LSG2_9PEZI|nr:acid protease [Dissoconium aciculare CBS 342.82]KAF1818573.1 acid protease [Dissoconium aciculare CBS 342.82]
MAAHVSTIAPISWTPSTHWEGNDGSWNTFVVRAGTPPQEFRILPSTSGQELWLPDPSACAIISPSNPGYCGSVRGVLPYNGTNSPGFNKNASTSWDPVGLFTLTAIESRLGYFGNGDYGLDTVTWGNDTNSPKLTSQVVASTATLQWWMGLAGLGPKAINFTTYNDPTDSYLSRLAGVGAIDGLSWGYTAGAHYRANTPASLTLGGFDEARYVSPGMSFPMYADDSRSLSIGTVQMAASNTLKGDVNLYTASSRDLFLIDSAVPHIWVPEGDIPKWVDAFGLTYDNATELFLVSDATRSRLQTLNPTVTFTFKNNVIQAPGPTMNITLPYAAFDLQASYPYYTNATNYFPIRRAANSTQYVLGRTFLQEAYLIADYNRQNFTVAPARSPDNTTDPRLIPIRKPVASSSLSAPIATIGGLSSAATGGLIAGLAILALLAAALAAILLSRWRKRRRAQARTSETAGVLPRAELPCDGPTFCEAPSDHASHEKDSTLARPEFYSKPSASDRSSDVFEMPAAPVGHETGLMAEVPGSEGVRPELEDRRKFSFERDRRD